MPAVATPLVVGSSVRGARMVGRSGPAPWRATAEEALGVRCPLPVEAEDRPGMSPALDQEALLREPPQSVVCLFQGVACHPLE